MSFWQFNCEWFWTLSESRASTCDCCHAKKLASVPAKDHRSQKESQNYVKWNFIGLTWLIHYFSLHYPLSLLPSSLHLCLLVVPLSPTRQDDAICQTGSHILILHPVPWHLFTPEDEAGDESQLPLRKLAVDSHLVPLPQDDNCNVVSNTATSCLCVSTNTGGLTRHSFDLKWGVIALRNISTFMRSYLVPDWLTQASVSWRAVSSWQWRLLGPWRCEGLGQLFCLAVMSASWLDLVKLSVEYGTSIPPPCVMLNR